MQAIDDMSALGRLIAAYPARAELPAALGAVRFREHDACGGFPVALRGRGRIARRRQDGRELVLFDLGPAESCVPSTSCLLGDARYKAHAASETEAKLAVMPRAFRSAGG